MNILDLMSFFLPPWGRITRVGIDRTAIGNTPTHRHLRLLRAP